MTDEELASRAQGTIARAAREPQPLTRDRYQALVSQVKLLALEAEQTDMILVITAQSLFDLDPDVAR